MSDTLGTEIAIALDDRLDAAIESLTETSHRGRIVPELRVRGTTAYRELIVSYYRILYRVGDEVWIVAVLDHRRDLDGVIRERARRDSAR